MRDYTTLQHLLATGFDIGLDQYEIFDETHREELNRKIIDNYYLREINGTADAFKFYLNRALDQIMPYYNKMYKAELIEFDPITTHVMGYDDTENKSKQATSIKDEDQNITLNNTTGLITDDTRTTNSTTNQTTATDSTTTNTLDKVDVSDQLGINSKTPQEELLVGNITTNLYADEAEKVTNTLDTDSLETSVVDEDVVTANTEASTTTGNVTSDTTSNSLSDSATDTTTTLDESELNTFSRTEKGYKGVPSELIMKFRESLINIDMMIVDDPRIKECFMQVYF